MDDIKVTGTIDIRPEVHFDRTLHADLPRLDDTMRTLAASFSWFLLMVQTRGLEADITQKAWRKLYTTASELWTEGPA